MSYLSAVSSPEAGITRKERERQLWEYNLARRILGYVRVADIGEEKRRQHDRLGAKMYYGQHWDRQMPDDRAAITANVGMAIIRHKVAMMVKQDPIPIVEPSDYADPRGAYMMRKVIMQVWGTDGMREKTRRMVTQANTMRTAALKVLWDPVMNGGAGGISTDNISPWHLILDNRVSHKGRMEYCGHRATMGRSRAMLYYPNAAQKIRDLTDSQIQRKSAGNTNSASPISTPWKSTYLPPPSAAVINGKPVVTAFAGDIVSIDPGEQDVDLVEMYHRDHTIVTREMPVRDPLGMIKQEVVTDGGGVPQFDQHSDEHRQLPDGTWVAIPRFKLKTRDVTELIPVRKYPFWRRTTICVSEGDACLLEDIPWDRSLPFAFYTDLEPLDGILGRGSLLQCETLQALVNVGLSAVTDLQRFGALCAWIAGTSSGVTQSQIIPGIGQVIPVNDAAQFTQVESKDMDPQFFGLIDRATMFMERIIGATGVMQGEAAGRMDSAVGVDSLAEIGGSTVVECTQRLETTISDWAQIVGEFAQEFYDERHAIRVEDNTGNRTWERVSSGLLAGSYTYKVSPGSTMAWSESAKQGRAFQEYSVGLIDKQGYYEEVKKPNWRQLLDRMIKVGGPAAAMGPSVAPPKPQRPPGSGSHQRQPSQHAGKAVVR